MRKVLMLFVGLTVCSQMVLAQSSELIERSFSGESAQKTPQAARREIQDKASQKISEDLIK